MTSNTQEIRQQLAAEIDQLQTEKPHLTNLLQALRPTLLATEEQLGVLADCPAPPVSIDAVKYLGGISLIQQGQLFWQDAPWQTVGSAMATAIGAGFPKLAGDMAKLAAQIKDGRCNCHGLITGSDDAEQVSIDAGKIGIQTFSLQLFEHFLSRLILISRTRQMAEVLAGQGWKKGYCPVCGSFPQLAIIREKGQKWLQCSLCSHEWHHPRLTCPYCDHEDAANTNYMFVEGKKEEMAYLCDKCQKYVITSDQSGQLSEHHADVVALGLAHLDLILQGQGYTPMAESGWSVFLTPQGLED